MHVTPLPLSLSHFPKKSNSTVYRVHMRLSTQRALLFTASTLPAALHILHIRSPEFTGLILNRTPKPGTVTALTPIQLTPRPSSRNF